MLRITLAINAERIADYEVRNVGPVPDTDLHQYAVRPIEASGVGEPIITVQHHRESGAHALAGDVLLRLAMQSLRDSLARVAADRARGLR